MTVWASAWLAGAAAPDDVLDALEPWSEAHDVVAADDAVATALELPAPHRRGAGLAALLAALRHAATTSGRYPTEAALALPVPGDLRGLPPVGPFTAAALVRGEGVLLPGAGLGLVAAPVADGVLRWTVHWVAEVTPAPPGTVAEAERELREQTRLAASTLSELGVARHRPGVREEIAAALRARPRSTWPDGMPQRSLRVLQQAEEVDAILAAATADAPGGALSAAAAAARSEALRPLATAVRMARLAAVGEAVRVLAGSAGRH